MFSSLDFWEQLQNTRPATRSLRAGSPLSHTHERRRAKQSGGKESGEEASRKWACPDLCNFFIPASSERSEIPLVEKWEKQENCQSIMFDEERLNPIKLVIYRTIKTSRPHLESEEELSVRITDVLIKFQSFSG